MRVAHTDDYVLRRLLSRSEVSETRSYQGVPCREYMRARRGGYGRIWTGLRLEDAHVASYRVNKGPIPSGHHVLHHCDNPACWEPSHLWTGTVAENMADRDAKGRNGGWKSRGHNRPSTQRGAKHAKAKLTTWQVREFKRRLEKEPGLKVAALAREYGVSSSLLYGIRAGRNWTWLE